MRRWWIVTVALVVLSVGLALQLVSRPVQAAGTPQWEYAALIVTGSNGNNLAFVSAGNPTESDALQKKLDGLSKIGTITALDAMGEEGWEMVTELVQGNVYTYSMKRLVQ